MDSGCSALQGDTRRLGLADLCRLVLDQAGQDLQQVVQHAVDHTDEQRSQQLLRFVHNTRQRLLRFKALVVRGVLMKHRGASRAVTYLADLSAHAAALHQAAEHLFHSHQHYATQQPVPLFDVHTALSVVARGALDLPSFIGGVAPDVQPPKGKRGQLVGECNALLLQLLQSVQLPAGLRVLQIEDGLVVLTSDGEHEASLLLEPAPPIPLDVVVDSMLPLRAVATTREHAVHAEASSKPSTSAAEDTVKADEPFDAATAREQLRSELLAAGFSDDAFGVRELQWRWRLVNVAVQAGSGGGQSMTLAQLQFLRAELDFRMLHFRLAAVVRHCSRVLSAGVGSAADTDPPRGGMQVDRASVPAAHQAECKAPEPSTSAPSGAATVASSLDAVHSLDGGRTGGSADACLEEEYPSLLSAALSAPVALLQSVLHDVAASLAFRAACASASDLARSQSSCWREALHCGPVTKQISRGLRVGFWLSVPLLRASEGPAQVADTADSAGDVLAADAKASEAQQPANDGEKKRRPESAAGAAAIEVGTRDGALVVACDPPLHALWGAGDVADASGVACPSDPALPLQSGSLEGVLTEMASHTALAQLALLARHVTKALLQRHWSWRQLEASLHLAYIADTSGLRGSASSKHAASSGEELASQARVSTGKSVKASIAAASAASHRVPQTTQQQRTAVLKLVVRGHVSLLLTLELTSGLLCLHAGASRIHGFAVATALELQEAQHQLQRLQQGALTEVAAGRPQDPGVRLLPDLCGALADFLIDRLLRLRCQSRVAFASRLGLVDQHRPPFSDTLQATAVQNAPDLAAILPHNAIYFALSAMPPAPELLALPLAAGGAAWLRNSQSIISPSRWLHSQCFVAVGLDPAHASAGLPNVHLRMCGALLTCLVDTSGRVRYIGDAEPMPARVFRKARALFDQGASAVAVLAEVDAPGEAAAAGWWQHTQRAHVEAAVAVLGREQDGEVAGLKRMRCNDGGGAATNGQDHAGAEAKRLHTSDASDDAALREAGAGDAEAEWGPASVGHERLQVACMLAWARERALAQHVRAELQSAGVVFEEEQQLSESGRLGLGQRSVFLLRALPRRQPESSLRLPEGFMPWPHALVDSAIDTSGEGAPPDAAISSIRVELTGAGSWTVRMQAPALAAALRLTRVGVDAAAQSEHWRICDGEAGAIERRYRMCDGACAPPQCWQHAMEAALTKELFVAFALLQRPDTAPPIATAAAAAPAPPTVSFSYPGVTIDVLLPRVDRLSVHVRATAGAAEQLGADLESGALLHEMTIVQQKEHRLVRGAPGAAAATQLRSFLSPMLNTRLPASRFAWGAALTKHVRALELQLFLDAVAHTTVAHRALAACLPFDGAAAGLSRVQSVKAEDTIPPYRLLLTLTAKSREGEADKGYAVGVQLRAGGTAVLHFDLRQEQAPRIIQKEFWPRPAGEAGRSAAEAPLSVPGYAALTQQLCSHEPKLAWLPPDPRAAGGEIAAAAGSTVVVRQGSLKRAAGVIAKHLDAQLVAAPAG